jgi:hypothetical protein
LPVVTLHFVSGCEALRALKIMPIGEKAIFTHKPRLQEYEEMQMGLGLLVSPCRMQCTKTNKWRKPTNKRLNQ